MWNYDRPTDRLSRTTDMRAYKEVSLPIMRREKTVKIDENHNEEI